MSGYILKVTDLSAKNGRFCLRHISFSLEAGYIYAIAGENGSGKTTLLQTILNQRKLKTGSIIFDDYDPKANHVSAMNEIGFVSEDQPFFEDRTGDQIVEMLKGFYEDFDAERFRRICGEMKIPCGTTYRRLSHGEKMRFQTAFALAHSPKLLVLDEATAGMDPVFRIEFFDCLRRFLVEGGTVLMTSHNMAELEKQADYVAFMKEGELGPFLPSTI